MARMQVPRRYHSTALLLPDGRVLSAGSSGNWPPDSSEYRLEVFYPPYLFRGPRPRITSAPQHVSYQQQFSIGISYGQQQQYAEVPAEQDIDSVALFRCGSVTHTNNMDQRYIECPILTRSAGQVEAVAPLDGTVAPPGYYMLFLLSKKKVPSEAVFVRIG